MHFLESATSLHNHVAFLVHKINDRSFKWCLTKTLFVYKIMAGHMSSILSRETRGSSVGKKPF